MMSTHLSPARASEAAFETVIEQHLLDHGYRRIKCYMRTLEMVTY